MNGGFFVMEPAALDRIGPDDILEREPLERLAAEGELHAFQPRGLLGLHGHLQGQPAAERAVGERRGALALARQDVSCAARPILVTGAQGFIGSWLVSRLLDEGARVVVLRRDVPAESRFGIEGLEERCDVVLGDLVDYESLVRALNEYEVKAVFHLGAQTIVGTANRSPLSTYETNIRGTYMLLEACRAVGVAGDGVERVVVASSDKAYGDHDELPYSEDFALQPRYPYDVSKAATDMIARSYAVTYGLPVAVTRLANVYGGGDFNFSRIVPDTARALVRGERPGDPLGRHARARLHLRARTPWTPTWRSPSRSTTRRCTAVPGTRAPGGPTRCSEIVEPPDRRLRPRRRAGHPGGGDAARRDRPPVPRLEPDPRGARLGAALGARRRAQGDVGLVRAAPGPRLKSSGPIRSCAKPAASACSSRAMFTRTARS